MIQFPETAQDEWRVATIAANAEQTLRDKIEQDSQVEHEVKKLRLRHYANEALQQELNAEDTPILEMTTLATYKMNPAAVPADLIDGVMKENGLCVVIGPSGSGKTTVALQMLYSLMTGEEWLGQPVQQISGGVGIMSYDMDAAMSMDWMAGYPNVDSDKVSIVNAYKQGNPLGVPAMRAKIVSAWKALDVDVIVVDSFSASFWGHDQNDAAATMAHYRDLKKFALAEVEAKALIVLAHSTDSSPAKVRGSTVHKDTADTMVVITADDKTQQRTVKMEKYREARGQQMMTPVIVTAPDTVTHLVDLDPSAMSLAGYKLPPSVGAAAFPALPAPNEAPADSDSDSLSDTESEQEDDL